MKLFAFINKLRGTKKTSFTILADENYCAGCAAGAPTYKVGRFTYHTTGKTTTSGCTAKGADDKNG